MKKLLLTLALFVAFAISSFSVPTVISEGQTNLDLGKYKIEKSDPVIVNGDELITFVITYQNSPMEVKVVVKNHKNHDDYLTTSEKLSIQYVSNENYFGVNRIGKNGQITSTEFLDRSEYFRQKVLTPNPNTTLKNVRLIAVYFPMLIKES